MSARVVVTLLIHDVDPTLVDPHEVVEEILGVYDEARRSGNALWDVDPVDAEWSAS